MTKIINHAILLLERKSRTNGRKEKTIMKKNFALYSYELSCESLYLLEQGVVCMGKMDKRDQALDDGFPLPPD